MQDHGVEPRRHEYALKVFLREMERAVGLPSLEQARGIDIRILCSTKVLIRIAERDGVVEGGAWRTSFSTDIAGLEACGAGRGVLVEDSSLGRTILCPIPVAQDAWRRLLADLRESGLLGRMTQGPGQGYRGPHVAVRWSDGSRGVRSLMLMGGGSHQEARSNVLAALSKHGLCWSP